MWAGIEPLDAMLGKCNERGNLAQSNRIFVIRMRQRRLFHDERWTAVSF
jgi:hypothetical protein